MRGYKFGQGVSFSPDAFYSSHYGDKTVMFLSKVLANSKCLGDYSTVVPPAHIDTTTNDNLTVYVKYDDDTFYPEYILYFKYNRNALTK